MSGINEIAKLLGELEAKLARCNRCGTCQAACPVFKETGREADVARGKLALLDGLAGKMFKNPKEAYHRISKCLLCGSCKDTCAGNVNTLEIFLKARAIIVGYMGLSVAEKIVLRWMLARPNVLNRMISWGANVQRIFLKKAHETTGTSCAHFVSPLTKIIRNRHVVPLAPIPFHSMEPELNTTVETVSNLQTSKALFYPGCLIDKVFPNIASSSIHVLNHHGIRVWVPKEYGCCGIPAVSAGDSQTFQKLINYNLSKFRARDFDVLITACATCTFTIKTIWPLMVMDVSSELKAETEALAKKTMDINQFLVSRFHIKAKPSHDPLSTAILTYHDPCHLKKSLGIWAEPRTVIQSNDRYRFIEMPESDKCCGMGGSFGITHYNISKNIGKQKRERIRSTGCRIITTACPACMIQISDQLSRNKDPIKVKHTMEVYAETLTKNTSSRRN